MRTFKLTLDIETDSPWQHRDVPAKSRVLGVFQDVAPDTIAVHYETQGGQSERDVCVAFGIVMEMSSHELPLGHDPRTEHMSSSGNALDHVGSTQLRDGRVVHAYRRT